MSKQKIFKLKDEVTEDDLVSAGYSVFLPGATKKLSDETIIYIPLNKASEYGHRVIQYDKVGTSPKDLNPEDIEDLVARGWVELKGKL